MGDGVGPCAGVVMNGGYSLVSGNAFLTADSGFWISGASGKLVLVAGWVFEWGCEIGNDDTEGRESVPARGLFRAGEKEDLVGVPLAWSLRRYLRISAILVWFFWFIALFLSMLDFESLSAALSSFWFSKMVTRFASMTLIRSDKSFISWGVGLVSARERFVVSLVSFMEVLALGGCGLWMSELSGAGVWRVFEEGESAGTTSVEEMDAGFCSFPNGVDGCSAICFGMNG